MRLVLEGTRLGIWDWNPQTNEVTFDERWAEMLGWRLEEIEQNLESWSSRVHPDDLAGCFADIQANMEGKVPYYENVHRMRHRDGSWRYILDRGRIMERDEEGKPTRFTGTHTDITAQKVAELEAQAAANNQRNFLASMSHEIRTPLNGIIGIIDILHAIDLPQEVHNWIDMMKSSGELLQTVVDDILDLSKLDAGKVTLDNQPFDLHTCLNQAVSLFEERAHRQQTALSVIGVSDLPTSVVGDSHRLQQIIMNLVSNAIKFSEDESVEVSVSYETGELMIAVTDTGMGIENTEVIWDRYGQTQAGKQKRFNGTGLGLPIVKGLVELMKGTVAVTSRPGKGSRFTVHLPLFTVQATTHEQQQKTVGKNAAVGLRVLVAEDNLINTRVVKGMLDYFGCVPTLVTNGQEAIDAAQHQTFDVILMDVHMPEMDGITASKKLRESGCTTPIIALTADSMAENREQC